MVGCNHFLRTSSHIVYEQALKLKAQGNKLVGQKKFEEALSVYSQALEQCEDNAVLHGTLLSNRSRACCCYLYGGNDGSRAVL